MTEERCTLTDLIKSQCAHCLGHTEIGAAADIVADGPSFVAQWHGSCIAPACVRNVDSGDRIVHVVDSTGYAHEECAR